MASNQVLHVTDGSFETDVMKAETPVLLDFTATWCGPCKAIAPIVEEIAREFDGRLRVGKVDVDEAKATAIRYQIRNVPTLIVVKQGKEVARQVGGVNKTRMVALFQEHL
jgi:thioredoxin 1